jgi:hypothetical protein
MLWNKQSRISDRISGDQLSTSHFFLFWATAPSVPGPPHSHCFYITHNGAPQSVGIIWTSDKLVAPDNTQLAQQTDIHIPGGIRTHNLSWRATAGLQSHTFHNIKIDSCIYSYLYYGSTVLEGLGLLIVDVSRPQTRMSDQPDTENSTWQHTTFTTDRHPCPSGIRTRNSSRWVASEPRLRPRGHGDRQ